MCLAFACTAEDAETRQASPARGPREKPAAHDAGIAGKIDAGAPQTYGGSFEEELENPGDAQATATASPMTDEEHTAEKPDGDDPDDADSASEEPQMPPSANSEPVRSFTEPTPLDPELNARTWRLTTDQYVASVKALLGVEPDVSRFSPDIDNGVFPNFSSLGLVRVDQASAYVAAAEQVATEVSTESLSSLAGGCSLDAACRDPFIQRLLFRAFRRGASDDEVSAYTEIFDSVDAATDPTWGFRAVVKAVLTSPNFLYRTEIGAPEDEGKTNFELTDEEVATFVAFSVLGEAPSEELLEAALSGELTNKHDLAEIVADLLDSEAAAQQFQRFVAQWLQVHTFSTLEKSEQAYPGFTAAQPAIWQETATFLRKRATFDATLEQLLTTPVTEADISSELLAFYSSDASGGELGPRIGILSLGSVMATLAKSNMTSPTDRGVFIRHRLLCEELALPPNDIPPLSVTEEKGQAKSTRKLFEQHVENPACAACHQLTDQIGFVFENLDGAGRYRTLDTTQGASEPIDTSGKLVYTDVNRVLGGPEDLATALAQSDLVRDCLSIQAFRYYFGQAEAGRGLPPIRAGHAALQGSGSLGALVKALMTTDSTFNRRRD